MLQEEKEYPEWLEELEKPKVYRLAHELGSGASCSQCSFCPGLQLHFWRKKCLACSCSLEDHNYDEDGFPQYNILFGENKRRKTVVPFQGLPTTFDWVPEVNNHLIEEYMSSLPTKWRPIEGTTGSKYRKKQLGRQLPRYDVDLTSTVPLSEAEVRQFVQYQKCLRDNASGLGSVVKHNPEASGLYRATPAIVYNEASSENISIEPQFTNDLHFPRKSDACGRCSEPLMDGAVIVNATKLEHGLFHPNCFTCETCGELLVDLHYYLHEEKIYCGRDYAHAIKRYRCIACDELIFEREYTCAGGNFYHNRHFCCSICDEPLGGKQYLIKNNEIACPSCYENIDPKACITCKEAVSLFEERLQIDKNVYHKKSSCFCCGTCSSPLEEGRVYVKSSLLLCPKCLG